MPFIVLEGLDGAGKSTQVKLLKAELESLGQSFEYLHFPRFDAPVYGDLVARFLRGELGGVEEVDPYLVALIYAGDRAGAAPMIGEWLAQGKFVLVDRYVYSNIAYQCAKIEDQEEQERLREWVLHLEYHHHRIPKPDLSLFLDVPFSFTQRKLEEARSGEDRSYLRGKADIHEASLVLQEKVRQAYLRQALKDPLFEVIGCADQLGNMLPAEEIFAKIATKIAGYL